METGKRLGMAIIMTTIILQLLSSVICQSEESRTLSAVRTVRAIRGRIYTNLIEPKGKAQILHFPDNSNVTTNGTHSQNSTEVTPAGTTVKPTFNFLTVIYDILTWLAKRMALRVDIVITAFNNVFKEFFGIINKISEVIHNTFNPDEKNVQTLVNALKNAFGGAIEAIKIFRPFGK
ncbi:hypothetical protein C0J52_18002 [Blattella germanica]|nr:hypothetical protein C0J52_18002 [Blattella germanica]